MDRIESTYPTFIESRYCSSPVQRADVDVLLIGAGINLSMVSYLLAQAKRAGKQLNIVVADAGPMDLLTHMAHTTIPRRPFIAAGAMERFGGKLPFFGVSTPRPLEEFLRRWPYDYGMLNARFAAMEEEMGVNDAIPKSGSVLQNSLLTKLKKEFPDKPVFSAPLAINRDGRRWCPLDQVPSLVGQGVRLLAHFRVKSLRAVDGRIVEVTGEWLDGRSWTLRPSVVVLGVGVEESLPLLRQICCEPLRLETADHLRIDLHGSLPPGAFGQAAIDDLGVAVLLMQCRSRQHRIPYHLEIKVAPRDLWSRGFMPSGDNLRGDFNEAEIWIQVQAISAMHDRFPPADLLNVEGIPPVMSSRDATLHGEIVEVMQQVAATIGLSNPTFSFRPLLTNHHTYGALRVGKAVTPEFRFRDLENLYVMPPTAFVDMDDDANPVLKSRVLAQFAVDDIVNRWDRKNQFAVTT